MPGQQRFPEVQTCDLSMALVTGAVWKCCHLVTAINSCIPFFDLLGTGETILVQQEGREERESLFFKM